MLRSVVNWLQMRDKAHGFMKCCDTETIRSITVKLPEWRGTCRCAYARLTEQHKTCLSALFAVASAVPPSAVLLSSNTAGILLCSQRFLFIFLSFATTVMCNIILSVVMIVCGDFDVLRS